MKELILNYSLIVGLLIKVVYQLINHFVKINNVITISVCMVSITFIIIGVVYNGWCLGKHKNPYSRECSYDKVKNIH